MPSRSPASGAGYTGADISKPSRLPLRTFDRSQAPATTHVRQNHSSLASEATGTFPVRGRHHQTKPTHPRNLLVISVSHPNSINSKHDVRTMRSPFATSLKQVQSQNASVIASKEMSSTNERIAIPAHPIAKHHHHRHAGTRRSVSRMTFDNI